MKVHVSDDIFSDNKKFHLPIKDIFYNFMLLSLISMCCYNYVKIGKLEKSLSSFKFMVEDFTVNDNKLDNDENIIDEEQNYDYAYENSELNSNGEENSDETRILLGGGFTKQGRETNRQTKEKQRLKRNIVAASEDGILVNSESYADMKRKNNTLQRLHGLTIAQMPAQPSSFGSVYDSINTPRYSSNQHNSPTASPAPVYSRISRVMREEEDGSKSFRQSIRKPTFKSASYEDAYSSENPVIIRRRYRPKSSLEMLEEKPGRIGRIKPLPNIRYDGDTSRYVLGQHDNFNGNGHLSHPRKTYVDWKPKHWVIPSGMDQHFNMNDDGELTIKESGLYFIYAQIYFLDKHETNSFRVQKNDNVLLQCTSTIHSLDGREKGNTCYTAGADYLDAGDKIHVRDLHYGHYSLFEPGKSFFGVIKLGDTKL